MAALSRQETDQMVEDYYQLRAEKGWDLEDTKTLAVFHCIKGYHHFRTRPLKGIGMLMRCVREPENIYDRYAVKVVIPTIDDLPNHILNVETRALPRRQTVRDIAGKTVGRLPADIAQVVSEGIRTEKIKRANAIYTGVMEHGGPVPGGGVMLKCAYLFELSNSQVMDEMTIFFNALKQRYL